jgi:hypothetical protein
MWLGMWWLGEISTVLGVDRKTGEGSKEQYEAVEGRALRSIANSSLRFRMTAKYGLLVSKRLALVVDMWWRATRHPK